MMFDGGWYMMLFGPLLTLAILGGIAAVVILGVRRSGAWTPGASQSARTPIEILQERFARGEIDKAEFEDRRRVLGD